MFQSTRPRGARPTSLLNLTNLYCFNPRAHGGRDKLIVVDGFPGDCFNPRAHGGRDVPKADVAAFGQVSIHAPTGGATAFCMAALTSCRFQSTRPRGARLDFS